MVIDEGQLVAGHYRLLERVGSGSMGVVWRARDERLERVVAIKQLLLQPGLTDEQREDARRRAMREARIAARLHHANAIVVFDVAEHDGDPWLVMEYLPSRSLAAVLGERGSLAVPEVAALGSQIAAAIAVAHACGIVHRDIKPGNVLIADDGVAKITDFGIARAVGDATITQTGTFAGTPAYLAPEVAKGNEPTSASDVFSFGATLYDAIEGGPPFPERQNQLALLRLVAEGAIQPPRQAGALTALLMRLLRAEPADRPSMAEASRQLAELAGSPVNQLTLIAANARPPAPRTQTDLNPPDPQPAPAPPATALAATPATTGVRRRSLLIIAAVLVVVVAGLGIMLANGVLGPGSAGGQAGGGSSTSSTNNKLGGNGNQQAPPTTASVPPATNSGTFQYSPAGQQLVDFYSDVSDNPTAAWAMLTPHGQQFYGTEGQFQAYWAQYQHLAPGKAHVDGTNADGSENVDILLTYTGGTGTAQPTMRVVQQKENLLIDGDSRIGGTVPAAPNSSGL